MAKFKYTIDGSELVIKDLPAVPDTYQDGEVLIAAAAEAGGISSAGVGTSDSFVGVSNQGETLPAASGFSAAGITIGNDGATLTGTQAAGTLDTLKVIINPGAVYALQYDVSSPITWGTVTDTTIPFTVASGEGWDNFGGGWAYSIDTGELDYVVSSSTTTTVTTLVTVTGTNTASASGILLQQAGTGLATRVPLTADALSIAAGELNGDTLTTGDSLAMVVLENRLESASHGSEYLRCKVTPGPGGAQNQSVRPVGGRDLTKVFAYVKIAGNVWA